MADFGERILGKGIVWAKDTPNFVGNRIGVQGMVKAMQLMLEDGLTIPEVDALFGPAMGRPKTAMFKTADLVGLDTMGHVAKNTYDLVADDEARDDFVMPDFVDRMIEKKLLGKKTKAGFYKTELTPEWKMIRKVINPRDPGVRDYWKGRPRLAWPRPKRPRRLPEKMRAVVYGDDKGPRYAWKVMANALIYAANRIPEISDTIVEIDNAMKWGYNFEMGPFETWDAIGVEAVGRADGGRRVYRSGARQGDAGGRRHRLLQDREGQALLLRFCHRRATRSWRSATTSFPLRPSRGPARWSSPALRPPWSIWATVCSASNSTPR